MVLLLPALVLVGEQVGAGSATLTAPARAAPGQQISLTGQGFPRNAHLQIVWDGTTDGMPITKSTVHGEVGVLIGVPETAVPGEHTVAALEQRGRSQRSTSDAARGGALASTTLEVVIASGSLPTAPVVPSDGVAGTSPAASATPSASPMPAPPTASPNATSTPQTAAPTAVATPAATAVPSSGSTPPPHVTVGAGIWLSQAEIMALPTSGAAWDRLVSRAHGAIPSEDLSCQDASGSTATMSAALVAARTNDNGLRTKVRDELMRIIGSENGSTCGHPDRNRPLGVGRNLAGYVIAADLIGFRTFDPGSEGTWRRWLSSVRSQPLIGGWALNSNAARADHSNWGAHQAAALTAANAYLGDVAALALDAAWARAWVDPNAPMPWIYHTDKHDYSWSSTGIPPRVPVNPAGTVSGVDVGGIPLVDMQRGGGFTTGKPVLTNYPRESLVGRTVQFEILHRMGYPAYGWGDRGLLRIAQRLLALSQQWESGWYEPRMNAYWILASRYGAALPRAESAIGRQVPGVDWTHRGS